MKKILVFGYNMDIGGAEKSLLDTLNYLTNKYEIDLYLLEKKGDLLNDLDKSINIFELKKNLIFYIFFRYISLFRKIVINSIANSKDYDFAVGYIEGRSATWVSDIKKKIKKIAWIHCDVSKFDIGISYYEAKKSYNNMDYIICVSNEAKNNFCNKYSISKGKVSVINNFIDENLVKEKSLEFNVHNNVFTFLNVAKMRKEKRQDRLIKAAAMLKRKGYKFKIQLIGDGPNLEFITKMMYDNDVDDVVEILGVKKNPYPYIKNCDYFILPSSSEGYGIVIKEALTLGKKIITTNTVGPKEILQNGKLGIIVSNTDSAVIKVMEEVLKNKDKYNYLDNILLKYEGDNEEIKKKILKLFGE
ncbi:MAG: glycosyltransferase [Bacilli bacterium]